MSPRTSLLTTAIVALACTGAARTATASPEYKCVGDRVEKASSTQFTIRHAGDDLAIEKGGSTKGNAVKRNGAMVVEVGGSSKATIANGKIEKGGSSWSTVAEAQKQFDCSGHVAATLWVLFQLGVLP